MTGISGTAKKLIHRIIAISLAALIIGLAVILFAYRFTHPLAYCAGLVLGSLSAVARVILLERALERSMSMGADGAKLYVTGQFFLRYAVTGGIIAAAALLPGVSLVGAVVGALTLQPAAYVVEKFTKREV